MKLGVCMRAVMAPFICKWFIAVGDIFRNFCKELNCFGCLWCTYVGVIVSCINVAVIIR